MRRRRRRKRSRSSKSCKEEEEDDDDEARSVCSVRLCVRTARKRTCRFSMLSIVSISMNSLLIARSCMVPANSIDPAITSDTAIATTKTLRGFWPS